MCGMGCQVGEQLHAQAMCSGPAHLMGAIEESNRSTKLYYITIRIGLNWKTGNVFSPNMYPKTAAFRWQSVRYPPRPLKGPIYTDIHTNWLLKLFRSKIRILKKMYCNFFSHNCFSYSVIDIYGGNKNFPWTFYLHSVWKIEHKILVHLKPLTNM